MDYGVWRKLTVQAYRAFSVVLYTQCMNDIFEGA